VDMGIEQKAVEDARKMGCCHMNEFRARVGIPPYNNWEELAARTPHFYATTEDYELACQEARDDIEILKEHYVHIDNLELAVGFQCEETTNTAVGFSLTMGQGFIADAFSAVRQDKYYQKLFTPAMYTQWGMDHAKTACLQDLVNRHTSLPTMQRHDSLCRLPQNWRAKHEVIKKRSRVERQGMQHVKHLSTLLYKFKTVNTTGAEEQTLLSLLQPEGCPESQRHLVLLMGLKKKELDAKRREKLGTTINDESEHNELRKQASMKELAQLDKTAELGAQRAERFLAKVQEAGAAMAAGSATPEQASFLQICGVLKDDMAAVVKENPEYAKFA